MRPAPGRALDKVADSNGLRGRTSPGLPGISVDKSVEFSYEELAKATEDFSIAYKIGQGGFGSVYYAELRGEVCTLYLLLSLLSKCESVSQN